MLANNNKTSLTVFSFNIHFIAYIRNQIEKSKENYTVVNFIIIELSKHFDCYCCCYFICTRLIEKSRVFWNKDCSSLFQVSIDAMND